MIFLAWYILIIFMVTTLVIFFDAKNYSAPKFGSFLLTVLPVLVFMVLYLFGNN